MYFHEDDMFGFSKKNNLDVKVLNAGSRDVKYKMQCCQNILYLKYYTLFWQSLRIILYTFFQSNNLRILYLRIFYLKASKLLIIHTFFLSYLIRVSSLSTIEYIEKNLLTPLALAFAIHLFFKPCYPKVMIFSHPPKRRRVTYASTIRPASASASTLSTSSIKPLHGIISYCTCILV